MGWTRVVMENVEENFLGGGYAHTSLCNCARDSRRLASMLSYRDLTGVSPNICDPAIDFVRSCWLHVNVVVPHISVPSMTAKQYWRSFAGEPRSEEHTSELQSPC